MRIMEKDVEKVMVVYSHRRFDGSERYLTGAAFHSKSPQSLMLHVEFSTRWGHGRPPCVMVTVTSRLRAL